MLSFPMFLSAQSTTLLSHSSPVSQKPSLVSRSRGLQNRFTTIGRITNLHLRDNNEDHHRIINYTRRVDDMLKIIRKVFFALVILRLLAIGNDLPSGPLKGIFIISMLILGVRMLFSKKTKK